jgi:hypothetical protein
MQVIIKPKSNLSSQQLRMKISQPNWQINKSVDYNSISACLAIILSMRIYVGKYRGLSI